jgi:hypothetical protein
VSKRSPGSKAAQVKGQATHRTERERHREKMRRKYAAYCESVAVDYPDGKILPASFDVWQRFNKAMDQSEPREINGIQPQG